MKGKGFKIYAALLEEIEFGHVWIQEGSLVSANFRSARPRRPILKIVNGRKRIYCEGLEFDENFMRRYNSETRLEIPSKCARIVVMNEWYRVKLGIPATYKVSNREIDLVILATNSHFARLRSCLDHPQLIVRVSTWLGIVGAFSGITGLFLAFIQFSVALL